MPQSRLLIIHLESLGSVLRSTALLAAMKRKFPQSHITWVTAAPAEALLMHNPLVDRVLTLQSKDLLALRALRFDAAFCLDKSLTAAGVLAQTSAEMVFGFIADPYSGAVVPASEAAHELWRLGLDNHEKFYRNQKSEQRLMHEALELGAYERDPSLLVLSDLESHEALQRRRVWARCGQALVGINTGCSPTIPYKKLTVEFHRELIQSLLSTGLYRIVLLGGAAEARRNQQIGYGLDVVISPQSQGLRDGIVSAQACDMIVSGDSLGLHLGVALNKWVVAWFGPTCEQEVDLYDRGYKVLSQIECRPCWKRSCQKPTMCYDRVSTLEFHHGLKKGLEWLQQTSSYKQPSLVTSYSPSL